MWSNDRFPEDLEPTGFARRLEEHRRRAGDDLVDLTLSNPTRVFVDHRRQMLDARRAAAEEAGRLTYDPRPLGLERSRDAVAAYYDRHGGDISAERIVLTASTSEAYAWLAKVLGPPSADILVPTPSYPLFEHLMRLECIDLRRYHYRFDGRWHLDLGHLRRQLDAAREPLAIVAVSPNNPTGHLLAGEEIEALADMCTERSLPLVVDEVFVDFGLDDSPTSVAAHLASGADFPLVILLSGLSKTAALPGVKVGWMALAGADDHVDSARRRIEFIADNFLSVSTSSQLLLPRVLRNLDPFHAAVQQRTRSNLAVLREAFDSVDACDIYPAEAGWYAVVRAPAYLDTLECTLELVDEQNVSVQPGFYYDFRRGGHFVVSLLPTPTTFREGAGRLAEALRSRIA